MTKKHNEFELEDANGNSFVLEGPDRHPVSISGLAMPPLQHWTTRAPFQHGRSHWGYAFQPRLVTIGLLLRACDRDGYWDVRKDTVDIFNPMNGPLKLRLRRPDRHVYELHDGWYQAGFELSATDMDDPNSVEGATQIEFDDPFWKWTTVPLEAGQSRDSDGRVCVVESDFDTQDELTIPFTGPFLLGTTIGTATLNAYNSGTWSAKPQISITGPLGDWILTNGSNGKQIVWNGYSIADDETVTLSVPDKQAVNGAGDDLTTYVSGDFGSFTLDPGANPLSFWGADFDSGGLYWLVPYLQLCWYVEILGT
jgi:hypothetical protein